jgi:hypothetical protein
MFLHIIGSRNIVPANSIVIVSIISNAGGNSLKHIESAIVNIYPNSVSSAPGPAATYTSS